ncbi:class I SAM-dependent methyltransferase [Bradyrhizobium sp. ma5]|uniref:class I SAM-dependent methyltransferase n=1 Tax=Bradyrhizobium sp. ma5 TaxID=3344828 RepID=UPI0035D470DB
MSKDWRDRLEAFFELRARQVASEPTLDDLCYIAGRNPALWTDEHLLADMKASIVGLLHLNDASSVLEVGCAAGLVALLVAPCTSKYVGVDLAEAPIQVARQLKLQNATFMQGEGERLQFGDRKFDAAFCYDVLSNFPSFASAEPLIMEMLRVVRPGGRVLIGSVPDQSKISEAQEIAERLAAGFLAQADRPPLTSLIKTKPKSSWFWKALGPLGFAGGAAKQSVEVKPQVTSYCFNKEDFISFGERAQLETKVVDIHPLNPYRGTRFNVLFIAK